MTAGVLSDALPYIQEHADRTIVIKYGGHAMEDAAASLSFAHDVVMLKQVFLRKWPLLVLLYKEVGTGVIYTDACINSIDHST